MVCSLLSNACVATSFYQSSANHVSFYFAKFIVPYLFFIIMCDFTCFEIKGTQKKSPRNIEAIKLKIPKILKESESKLFLFCVIAKSASSASTSISIVVPGFIIITFPAVFGLDLFPLIVCAHIRIFVFCFRHVLFLLYSYENFLNGFSYRFYRDPYNGAKTLLVKEKAV